MKWILKFLLKLAAAGIAFSILQVLLLKYIDPPLTPEVALEWIQSVINHDPARRPRYSFTGLEKISPNLQKAVLAAEDQRFLRHHGFDFREMHRAFMGLIKYHRVRGASTITMQAARSVFLLPSRNIARKLAEMYYTILMEIFWSKYRILEIYLNTIDWGTGITGAQAASQQYFSKNAKNLAPGQAALMAAVLPSPHKWSVTRPDAHVRARQKRIMRSMKLMKLPEPPIKKPEPRKSGSGH